MNFIRGHTRVLFIKVGAVFIPIGCLTDNPFSESSEMLDTTTRESNGWRTSRPTSQAYNISFSGYQINTAFDGGNANYLSYDRLKIIKRTRVLLEWRLASNDGLFVDSGFGYITSIGEQNEVSDYLQFDGEIQGFGQPTSTSETLSYVFQDGNNFVFTDGNNFIF
jgi:hypothetical protein